MESTEKRNNIRHLLEAPIRVSFFNKSDEWDAQMVNHCPDGMCFRSKVPFAQKSALLIRVEGRAWAGRRPEACTGLRNMTVSEVKWCNEITGENCRFFVTGVKHLPPGY